MFINIERGESPRDRERRRETKREEKSVVLVYRTSECAESDII
jgi:hypothetical protein